MQGTDKDYFADGGMPVDITGAEEANDASFQSVITTYRMSVDSGNLQKSVMTVQCINKYLS